MCDGVAMAMALRKQCISSWEERHAFVELEGRSRGGIFYDNNSRGYDKTRLKQEWECRSNVRRF